MRNLLFTILSIGTLTFCLSAQESDSILYPNFKVDGTLKNKFEYASETGMYRFSVRNSRIGVSGNINTYSAYKVQVELSNEGKFSVLDLSGTLMPVNGLSLTLGQTSIPLFNSYVVSPGEMMFANRAFLGKYFLSTRDLGVMAKYNLLLGTVPAKLEFGMFNGNTINNPVWKEDMAYGGRVELGKMQGARVTAKIYNYPKSDSTHFVFYGADFRYKGDRWKIETEIMKRKSKTEYHNNMLSYYVQGAYLFPVKTKMFEFIKPAIRWDGIDESSDKSGWDVNRLTAGLGFGYNNKRYSSLLRLDYEWYFVNNSMDIFAKNREMDSNKITMELLFTF
ncbi:MULTISPECIES: hypothetical protein [unclassified Proteiniphilum]|jgi:hypothetical protein|uniref:hypothetical protein n=1 Tax=unclassified Proteiniphilum TaxID=2622718 RepID=UPI00257B551A|nr:MULTISPECIES: hypothetical protein [unclassified Proteiniphilum]